MQISYNINLRLAEILFNKIVNYTSFTKRTLHVTSRNQYKKVWTEDVLLEWLVNTGRMEGSMLCLR